jgi:hypothetical protein
MQTTPKRPVAASAVRALLFLVAAIACALIPSAAGAQTDRDNAESVAKAWVTGIDSGNLGNLYDQYAGPTLQQGFDKQRFGEQMGIIRIQLGGPARTRNLTGDQEFHQTPTGQRGMFHYFRYRAQFPNGTAVFQDVYLEKVNDAWKVAGIWLNPAP